MADRAVVMESGKIIAADTPPAKPSASCGSRATLCFPPCRPRCGSLRSPGNRPLPLTVREGRNWWKPSGSRRGGGRHWKRPPWGGPSREPVSLKEYPRLLRGVSAEVPEGSFACGGRRESTTLRFPMGRWKPEVGPTALSLKELWFRYERNSPDVLRGVSAEVPEGSLLPLWAATEREIHHLEGNLRDLQAIPGKTGCLASVGGLQGDRAVSKLPGHAATGSQEPVCEKKTVREDLEKCARPGKKLPA